jgi:hypothetical protein
VINQAGGIQVANAQSGGGVPAQCSSAALATIQQTDFAYDLLRDYVSAHVVVTGPPAPLGGDHGVGVASFLDSGPATVSADPLNHKVTISGAVSRINGATALYLNQAFPQPMSIYDANMEFVSGDLFGAVFLTLNTR